ncbi:MAG: small multi-drug export protein [Firmicutes bacterium]|nr:small multi-drug export protein [Bacillota bacterium]
MNSLISWLTGLLAGIPKEAVVFIVSMLPIVELRGGLIAASALGIPYARALGICMLGNFLPIPFILWLLIPIFRWLKEKTRLKGLVEKLEARTLSKKDKVQKYEFWGLVLFVGIPLPGTGAWTGSMLAALLGMDRKKAILAIGLGLVMAAAIMSFVSYGLPWIIRNI